MKPCPQPKEQTKGASGVRSPSVQFRDNFSMNTHNQYPARHRRRLFAPACDAYFANFPVPPKYMELGSRDAKAIQVRKVAITVNGKAAC
jgi:hypothetical protein